MPNAIYCSVLRCYNNSRNQKELSYFRFPLAKKRVQQWAELIGRRDIVGELKPSTNRVCSIHFTPDMFINKRLNKLAVPTLYLPDQQEQVESDTPVPIAPKLSPSYTAISSPQILQLVSIPCKQEVVGDVNSTEVNMQAAVDPSMPIVRDVFSMQGTSGITTLKRNAETNTNNEDDQYKNTKTDDSSNLAAVSKHQHKIIDNRNFIFEAGNFIANFSIWQTDLKTRFNEDKGRLTLYALNLYLTNPQLYKFSHKNSILPSPATIRKTKVHFSPEVSGDLITLLSKRLKANHQNYKFCTISIGEMTLRKNVYYDIGNDEIIGLHTINKVKSNELAKYAFVLQLRGCAVDYKQPLGYAFLGAQTQSSYDSTKEALRNWLLDTIRRLTVVGYTVTAVVSEHTKILVGLPDMLGVTVNKPYFNVDNERIHYTVDISQLLQDIYSNLPMLKILQDDIKLPIWNYIEAFYKRDQQREVKLAPKLTDAHFRPISSPKSSYAKDILSYAVAAGMSVDIEMGNLPLNAKHAVNFILKFSKFLDILNSKTATLSSAKKDQDCLKDFLEYLQNVKIFKVVDDDDSTDITKMFKGMQITLNSIILLQKYCLLEGIKYDLIIKNSIGHFVRELHKQSRNPRELTPIQFRRAFSKLVMKSLFKNTPSNVSVDDQDAILHFRYRLLFESNIKLGKPALSIETTDYRMALPKKHAFTYICGYLVRKISEKHFCSPFNYFKTYHEGYVRNNLLLKEFQAFSKGKKNGHFTVPSKKFINFMRVYETVFLNSFHKCLPVIGVGRKLLNLYLGLHYSYPCVCFPKEYAIKLFLRMRLYYLIKLCNRNINHDHEDIPFYLVVNCLYDKNHNKVDEDEEDL